MFAGGGVLAIPGVSSTAPGSRTSGVLSSTLFVVALVVCGAVFSFGVSLARKGKPGIGAFLMTAAIAGLFFPVLVALAVMAAHQT